MSAKAKIKVIKKDAVKNIQTPVLIEEKKHPGIGARNGLDRYELGQRFPAKAS